MPDFNLLVNTRCPHCNKPCIVALSGFAGELATRHKECKFCGKEFHIHMISISSQVESPSDGDISAAKSRIKYLREQRKQSLAELLIKQEIAVKLYNESLEMTRQMRDKSGVN